VETPQTQSDFSGLWDEKLTATFLRTSVEFLQQDRVGARRIAFIKLGRAVRYDPDDVKAYVESCKVRAR
jgi:hypothetical protein